MGYLTKVILLSLISFSICANSGYLTHLQGSEFLVNNTSIIVEYRCTYGGEPLAVWGAKIDEEIDSKKTLEPIYVKEGFVASNLDVESYIRGEDVEVGNLHFVVKNPANGGLSFSLSRNVTFFVDTVLFSTKRSDFSDKIVSNFEIITDKGKIFGAVPHKEYNFAASTGLFVYENTKEVTSFNYSWDQLTEWSNYFVEGIQDIYVNVTPRKYEEDRYEGNGFWVCGGEEEQNVTGLERYNKLKNKHFYEEYDESVIVDKKTKKMKKVFDESFRKGFSKANLGFLQ
jgi:hypothetical protein